MLALVAFIMTIIWAGMDHGEAAVLGGLATIALLIAALVRWLDN
jgi:hypothetical protein